jgi:hypothetical protein
MPAAMRPLRLPLAATGVAAAVVATAVTYSLYAVHPHEHTPLDQFLTTYGAGNAAIWPAQVVCYAAVAAIIALTFWPGQRAERLASALAAACFAWAGVAFFLVVSPDMSLAGGWAAVFAIQALLIIYAGVVRADLVIRPRRDLASALGAVVIAYALVAYPIIGLLTTGHPLSALPVIGLSPCATVILWFGLLLWARPPAPLYLLPLPLAWALNAAPANQAAGFVPDIGLIVAGVGAAVLIIWRDRTETWRVVAAGLLLALMIAASGHDDVLIGTAAVLVVLALLRQPHPVTGGIARGRDVRTAGG